MRLTQLAIIVRDYDEAIAFYVNVLGFTLIEDTNRGGGKRWVRVHPPGSVPYSKDGEGAPSATFLLAKAVTPEQLASVGNQTGGRVFLFMDTDDFWRDYHALKAKSVVFLGEPREEEYGTVVVFVDLYGNKFDLIGRR
jgi:catechol 2,3-dioxygenase-like lactoylglutathione lyase family enzyme